MKRLIAMLLALAVLALGVAVAETAADERAAIEAALNLKNNPDQTWTYVTDAGAWVLSVVTTVANPVLPDNQGVSVCVPGAYVTGIDTDGDGVADVVDADAAEGVQGSLVIDYDASVTSTNGQTYTASTAPVLFETGGAGYSAQANSTASTNYAADGYIYMTAGNRGKQSSYVDDSGNTVYTGDAPDMIVDGKNAIRYVRYNILLGNLPGSAEYFVTTGGSGAGAHTIMVAATGDNPDYFDYEIACGAVGIYKNADGGYDNVVSDAVWGAVGYSPITSLAEADLAMAFEYTLDDTYDFGSEFQKALAGYLSQEYMEYINACGYTVNESLLGVDLDGDCALESDITLTIEYDDETGYFGTYLDLYLAKFIGNLQSYVDNLAYTEGWTWFNADGSAMSDEEVAAMTKADLAQAFIEGRYAKASGGRGGFGGMGGMGNMRGGMGGMRGDKGEGGMPDFANGQMPDFADGNGPMDGMPDFANGQMPDFADGNGPMDGMPGGVTDSVGNAVEVGTPDVGSTQSASGGVDSNNYGSYAEMVASYAADIAEVEAGDEYGNNQVTLYNPVAYIGAEDTIDPTWVRMVCGAQEGDISMLNSLNLWLKMLESGVDAVVEWQWDGGHVPSEILGDGLSLYIDQMYGEHMEGATEIAKPAATGISENGSADSATGTDLTGWVSMDEAGNVSFSLADVANYRTSAASKAIPGFDVIDYGQEDYVFGSEARDARHWNAAVFDYGQ